VARGVTSAAASRKRKGGVAGFLAVLFVLIVLAALAAVGGYFYAHTVYTQPGPATANGKPRIVMIEPGASAPAIARQLKQAGAIGDEFQFKLAVKAAETIWKPAPLAGAPIRKPGDKLVMKTGEFAIPSAASMEQIISVLSTAKPIQYTVVVPEGLTSAVIVKMLTDGKWDEWHPAGQPADTDARTFQLGGTPPAETPEEGTLLPGDYQVLRGDTIEGVLKRMSKAQDELFKSLWDNRKPDLPFTSQREAVNLASIVEKETGVPQERPLVAAAFITRLKEHIRLQSDATVTYVLNRGDKQGTALTAEENRTTSPYNTYQNDGLPPTPICNPGKDAIAAVLNPPDSRAIYFVADGVTGGHRFAETLAEHEKNVASLARLRAGERAAANAQKKAADALAKSNAPAGAPSPAAPAVKPAPASPTPAAARSPEPAPQTRASAKPSATPPAASSTPKAAATGSAPKASPSAPRSTPASPPTP
jgi:UPF0755 protein